MAGRGSAYRGEGKSLTGLEGIGPSLARRLQAWIESPPLGIDPPPIRPEFITLARARRTLAKKPQWGRLLHGDLQMHTVWSDGTGTISEMAGAAIELGYQYIAITYHTKRLKIAGGLDEYPGKPRRFGATWTLSRLDLQPPKFEILQAPDCQRDATGDHGEERLEKQGHDIKVLNWQFGARLTDFTILRAAEVNPYPTREGETVFASEA